MTTTPFRSANQSSRSPSVTRSRWSSYPSLRIPSDRQSTQTGYPIMASQRNTLGNPYTSPTRTAATESQYYRRANALIQRFQADHPHQKQPGQPAFLQWLEHLKTTVTPSTWRQYRASLVYRFHQEDGQDAQDLATRINEITTDGCIPRTGRTPKERRTSSRKKKSLSEADCIAIHNHLKTLNSRYRNLVHLLIEGGRLTGLRPTEWRHTTLAIQWNNQSTQSDIPQNSPPFGQSPQAAPAPQYNAEIDMQADRHPVLVIQNAKNSNRRTHGDTRTLHLTHLEGGEYRNVVRMLRMASRYTSDADWQAAYNCARKVLNRAVKHLWPHTPVRPTLYSARHQFSADAKAAGFSKVAIAAMMGHASDRTATTHYGRRKHGHRGGGFRVQPDARDEQHVLEAMDAQHAEQAALRGDKMGDNQQVNQPNTPLRAPSTGPSM